MSSVVSPSRSVWSREMGVTTDTWPSPTLVASVMPPRPTSMMATLTGWSANTAKARMVRHSKYVSRGWPSAVSSSSTICRYGRISSQMRTNVSSETGSPSRLIRSVTLDRCGLV
jgi:hypothetical protein